MKLKCKNHLYKCIDRWCIPHCAIFELYRCSCGEEKLVEEFRALE